MKFRRTPVAAVAAVGLLLLPLLGEAAVPSRSDARFLVAAISRTKAEIRFGEIAQAQALSVAVRQFAAQMEKDRSRLNDQLIDLALRRGVRTPAGLSDDARTIEQLLLRIEPGQFDAEFMRVMVEYQSRDVAAFENETGVTRDRELRQFTRRSLPALQAMLKNARELATLTRGQL